MSIHHQFPIMSRLKEGRTERPVKVYIAGPMTGLEHFNYPAFYEAHDQVKAEGFHPVSPAHGPYGKRRNPPVPGWEYDYRNYLREGIEKLLDCDRILLLDGWENSKGAQLEKTIADAMGIAEITLKEVEQ